MNLQGEVLPLPLTKKRKSSKEVTNKIGKFNLSDMDSKLTSNEYINLDQEEFVNLKRRKTEESKQQLKQELKNQEKSSEVELLN